MHHLQVLGGSAESVGLLPREHGAYFQMGLHMATAFAVAGVALPPALFALAVIAGFLAHEPLLVVLELPLQVRHHHPYFPLFSLAPFFVHPSFVASLLLLRPHALLLLFHTTVLQREEL